MSKLTILSAFAVFMLALLTGCENSLIGKLDVGGGNSSKSPTIKTDAATPTPAPAPKPEIIFVYTYSYEGLPITAGRIIELNPPDQEFPKGSVTIEIDIKDGKPVHTRIDPRAWKIVKPSSPTKAVEPAKAEIVPVK